MTELLDFENKEICIVCEVPISFDENIGAMTPKLNMLICQKCLELLGELESCYFQIFTILAEEILSLRSKLKITPKATVDNKSENIIDKWF